MPSITILAVKHNVSSFIIYTPKTDTFFLKILFYTFFVCCVYTYILYVMILCCKLVMNLGMTTANLKFSWIL